MVQSNDNIVYGDIISDIRYHFDFLKIGHSWAYCIFALRRLQFCKTDNITTVNVHQSKLTIAASQDLKNYSGSLQLMTTYAHIVQCDH